MALSARWISLHGAHEYVARWHRKLHPPQGAIVAMAAYRDGGLEPVGVIVLGRPTSRINQARGEAEVLRCAVPEGERNVVSFLYGRIRRVAQALGFTRVTTSTLVSEGGASMRAIGATLVAEKKGESWDTPSRPRVDRTSAQLEPKYVWAITPSLLDALEEG